MTTEKARATLHSADARLPDVVEAAAFMACAPKATVDDLLACLDYGGLPAEFAAMELYRRTSRPVPRNPKAVQLKRMDWEKFLDKRISKRQTKTSAGSIVADGCWVDVFEEPCFSGRLCRVHGPAVLDKLAGVFFKRLRSIMVGPAAAVTVASRHGSLRLLPSQIVPDLAKTKFGGIPQTIQLELAELKVDKEVAPTKTLRGRLGRQLRR